MGRVDVLIITDVLVGALLADIIGGSGGGGDGGGGAAAAVGAGGEGGGWRDLEVCVFVCCVVGAW